MTYTRCLKHTHTLLYSKSILLVRKFGGFLEPFTSSDRTSYMEAPKYAMPRCLLVASAPFEDPNVSAGSVGGGHAKGANSI